MKTMKKLFALLLALTMVFGLAATGFAAGENGKITITNTVKDETYTIYRIFDLESYDEESGAYSYKITEDWADFADTEAAKEYISVDTQGYVTWVGNETADSVAAFAKLALENAPETNQGQEKSTADASSVEFDELPLGYYLIDTSLGALCGLTTTKPEATVIEKNAKPTIDKEVQEGNSWGDKNDANIGDTVHFRTTITVEGFADSYVLHDTMSEGLTYTGVTGVTLNGTAVEASGNYIVTPNAKHGTGTDEKTCTFDVVFSADFCKTLKSGDKIVVSYDAVLNEKAEVSTANENEAELDYKDNAGVEDHTEPDKTETFTWELGVIKFTTGSDGEDAYLSGAKFVLHKDSATGTVVNFVQDATDTNLYKVCTKTDCTHTHVTEITTDETGKFQLEGLDSGTYFLEEIAAPQGYNKLPEAIEVTIDDEGKVTEGANKTANAKPEVKVENHSGTELPSTGGIGTTLFYVIGSIMMIGAAVVLISKKRVNM